MIKQNIWVLAHKLKNILIKKKPLTFYYRKVLFNSLYIKENQKPNSESLSAFIWNFFYAQLA